MSSAASKKAGAAIDSFMPGDIVLARFGLEMRRARVTDVTPRFVQVRLVFDGTPEEYSPTSIYRPEDLQTAS